MSDDDDSLIARAKAKREEAARARRLSQHVFSADLVQSFRAYASQLDNDAFALEQQAAQLKQAVERSHRLAEDVRELSEEAMKQLAALKAKLDKK